MVREISPALMRQIVARSPKDARRRGIISRKNTSQIFTHIHEGNFGGHIVQPHKVDFDILENGTRYNFHPDIVSRRKQGWQFTEVKAISARLSRPHCSFTQTGNYCYALLRRIDNGDELPDVEYAFYRYGHSRTTNGLGSLSNPHLVEQVAHEKKSLLLAPLNLVLFLVASSFTEDKNQTSSDSNLDSQRYWRPNGKVLTRLHRAREGVVERLVTEHCEKEALESPILKERYYEDDGGYGKTAIGIGDLFLEGLRVEAFWSRPLKMRYASKTHDVSPFSVTRYSLDRKTHRAWLRHLYKNHDRILTTLGIRDLHTEAQEVPF